MTRTPEERLAAALEVVDAQIATANVLRERGREYGAFTGYGGAMVRDADRDLTRALAVHRALVDDE